jgi:hypothetical protein
MNRAARFSLAILCSCSLLGTIAGAAYGVPPNFTVSQRAAHETVSRPWASGHHNHRDTWRQARVLACVDK